MKPEHSEPDAESTHGRADLISRLRTPRFITGACVLVAAAVAIELSPYGFHPGSYRTALGEHRTIELSDHTRIDMDARTRLRERFTAGKRAVELIEGQARFSVARDPARPFSVRTGDHTTTVLGTVFNVEYILGDLRVTTLEGKLSVGSSVVAAGEEVHISKGGAPTVTPGADLEAATAWLKGKIVFHGEPLAEAARRVNYYSDIQIVIADQDLASVQINGTFDAGDAWGFVASMQQYLPITAQQSGTRIEVRTQR